MSATTSPIVHSRSRVTANDTTATEIRIFLATTFLLATGLALALPGSEGHEGPVALLTALVPSVAVCITRLAMRSRRSRRPFGLRRPAWRAWPAAFALPVVAIGSSYALAHLLGFVDFDGLGAYAAGAPIQLLVLMVILLGEELGWRGFLLPRLSTHHSGRVAALWTGVAHGLFHVPLLALTVAYDSDGSRWIVVPGVVFVVALGGVVFGWLRLRFDSLWPTLVAHATVNLCLISSPELVADHSDTAAHLTGEGGVLTIATVGLVAWWALRCARWPADGR